MASFTYLDEEKPDAGFTYIDDALPKPKQNSGIVGDIGTALKRGVLQMPGMATGLADIAAAPVSIATGVNRPVSRAADWLGEQTGLQFGKWAEAAGAEYSPEMQQAQQNVEQAKGFFPTLGAVAQNPRVAAQVVAESLPSTIAGGLVARGAMGAVAGAEKLAALRTAAGSADAAVANAARRELLKSGAIAAGIGEGAVTAGQQMAQTGYDVDPALAAGAAIGAGVGTGIIGGLSGRLASSALGRKLGLSDIETSMAAGTLGENAGKAGAAGFARRIGAGAIQEGLLEEAPQSYQEQVWQNIAAGKPATEGAAEAAALGAVAGGVMGAGVNIASGPLSKAVAAAPGAAVPPAVPVSDGQQAPAAAGIVAGKGTIQQPIPQFTAPPQPVTGGAPLEQAPTAMPVPQATQNAPAAPGSPSPVSAADTPLPAKQAEAAGAPIQPPQGPLPSADQAEIAIPPAQGPEAAALPVAAKPANGIAAALQYPQQVTEGGGPLAQQAADMPLGRFGERGENVENGNPAGKTGIPLETAGKISGNPAFPADISPDIHAKKAARIASSSGIAGALVTPQQPTFGGVPLEQSPTEMPLGKYGNQKASEPAATQQVPPRIRSVVAIAIDRLRSISDSLDNVVAARGNGAILAGELAGRQEEISKAKAKLDQFRTLAAQKGIDAEAVIKELGGEPDFAKFAPRQTPSYAPQQPLSGAGEQQTAPPYKKATARSASHYRVRLKTPLGNFDVFVEKNKDSSIDDYKRDAKNAFAADSNMANLSGIAQISFDGNPEPVSDVSEMATVAKNAKWARIAKVEKAATQPQPKPRQQPQPAPIMRRDDLVGAIMRVTGGDGINSNMALTIAGDTAGRGLSKLRGLFTNRGTIDLGEVATRLREDEGFDVRDGEHLSELIRAASFGDTAVSMERAERDQDTAEDKRHRDYIRQNAKKLKIKSVAVKFTDLEQRVIAALTRRHERAVELLDERAKKRFDAALEESYALLPEDVVDAVLVDLSGRGLSPRELWNQATETLRYMVADARAQKEQEELNAIEGAEPDWLKDDDGRGNQPAGGRGEADRVAEEARGEAGFSLAAQTHEEIAAAEAAAKEAKQAEAAAAAAEARKEKAAQDKAEKDRRAAEVLKEREAAKKAEVDKAAEEFALGQVAPEPVVKKVTTEEARGQEGLRFSQESPQDNQPAFYSQLSGAIASARVTSQPAAQWKAWINGNAGNLGIKKDEIEWSGVLDYLDVRGKDKVTKAEIADYLNGNGVRVEDVVKADPYVDYLGDNLALRRGDQTKFSDYWQDSYKGGIPGTYREILVTLPARGDEGFKSNHWDEPNVLVHIRTDEVIGADGNRYLRVGEIQSDWGQKGKKDGFKGRSAAEIEADLIKIPDGDPAARPLLDELKAARDGVPQAPFVTDTRAWAALGIKRAIIHAINSGVDGVVFGTGEQNANLYNLSKRVNEVSWRTRKGNKNATIELKNGDQLTFHLDKSGKVISVEGTGENQYNGKRFDEVIGKDVADKVMSDEDGVMSGEGLNIGGLGMRAFYDQIIPSVANDVLKKVGGGKVAAIRIDGTDYGKTGSTEEKAKYAALVAQPGFTITPQMRAKIQSQGVPLFSFAGQQSATADQFQLDRAKQLLADGANANSVRQQTGWFKGVDGKWRYEIDDSGASLKAHGFGFGELLDALGKNLTLADVLDHPVLFAAYPSIAGSSVEAIDEKSQNNGELVTNKDGGFTIRVNAGLGEAKALSVMLHEIQHGIQNVEGFASGGNIDLMAGYDEPRIKAIENRISSLLGSGKQGKEIAPEINRLNARIAEIRKEDPYQAYRKLAGEVESRNVQQRQNFPADKRRLSDPLGTQDVAPEDVIVVFNGKEAKDAPTPFNTTRASAMAAVGASPADAAVFDMASEGKSAQEILSFLSKASRRPFNRILASALMRIGVSSTVSVDPVAGWRNNSGRNGAKFAASYSPKTDTVALYTPREAERHILHEFLHSATLKAIARGGPAARQMQSIFDYVQRTGTMSDQYGMGNFSRFPNETDAQFKKRALDEFTAELFTNPQFQVRLKQLPAPSGSKLKSAWDWIVRVIANMLGLRTKAQETALDRALSVGAALLQENAALTAAQGGERFSQEQPFSGREVAATPLKPGTKTLMVDGVERPALNSNGKPIHWSEEGVRNFWRWFRDSKVVDEQGRPLVRYHLGAPQSDGISKFRIGGREEPGIEKYPLSGTLTAGRAGVLGLSSGPGMWFGDSGNLSVGTRQWNRLGGEPAPVEMDEYGRVKKEQPSNTYGTGPATYSVYLSMKNPLIVKTKERRAELKDAILPYPETLRANDSFRPDFPFRFDGKQRAQIVASGYDGIIMDIPGWGREDVVFDTDQIKSATGNTGAFSPDDPDIRYNLAANWPTSALPQAKAIRDTVATALRSDANTSWITPFNTQYHKAEKWAADGKPLFKRVFNLVQQFLGDVSKYAVMAQNAAPTLLHEWRTISDVKAALSGGDLVGRKHRADIAAVAMPLYDGTLYGGGNPMNGIKWSDERLRTKYKLTDRQIKLYHEALAAVNVSMDEMAKSVIAQHAKREKVGFDPGMDIDDMSAGVLSNLEDKKQEIMESVGEIAQESVNAQIADLKEMDRPDEAEKLKREFDKAKKDAKADLERLDKTIGDINGIVAKNKALQAAGYFPLMRFGRHTVTAKDAEGKVQFFGMYDGIPLVPGSGQAEANRVAAQLKEEFPDWDVTTGIVNAEKHKLYQGVNLDALQLFAEHMEKDDVEPFQEFVRMTTNNRSAQRRMLHRKGTPGFDKDVRRTMAQFITSNARATSSNYHTQDMLRAAAEAEKDGGDIGAEAIKLVKYVQDPIEEAQALRGFLFFNFLGGSIASAMVNLTQTPAMTLPYLSKFEQAPALMRRTMAAAWMAAGKPEAIADQNLRYALMRAELDGVTAPQEIHQLMATAANNIFAGSRAANILLRGWGAPFSMAESFNRRIAFITAFKIGEGMGNSIKSKTGFDNAFDFAEDVVKQTQGIYNKGNRMNIGRGAVGATLVTFKQYSVMYLELLKRLPPKQRAIMVGVLLLSAGAGGLPGVDDLEDLWDTVGQWLGYATNSKRSIRNSLTEFAGAPIADVVLNGVLSRMGIDLHSRLGMQNLIPGTGILKQSSTDKGRDIEEFFGPAASVVKSVGDALENMATGRPDKAAMAVSPVAVRNAVLGGKMASTGFAQDARGRNTVPVNEVEAFAKGIGFNPKAVAEFGSVKRDLAQDQRLVGVKREEFAAAMADAILNNDPEARLQAIKDLQEWNQNNPFHRVTITPESIAKRVRDARAEGATRMLRSLPKGMRTQAAEELRQ